MRWYHYLAYFFGGAFLANTLPHLVNGVSGNAFQSPFASPPGVGLSSSIGQCPLGPFQSCDRLPARLSGRQLRSAQDPARACPRRRHPDYVGTARPHFWAAARGRVNLLPATPGLRTRRAPGARSLAQRTLSATFGQTGLVSTRLRRRAPPRSRPAPLRPSTPSGPPACAISGRPPPPLPPRTSAPLRTRSTALKRGTRSLVTPTTMPALPSSVTPTMATTPDPTCFLPSSARLRRSLISMPFDRARHQLHVADGAHAVGAPIASAAAHGELASWRRTARARAACARPAARRRDQAFPRTGRAAIGDRPLRCRRGVGVLAPRARSGLRCGARRAATPASPTTEINPDVAGAPTWVPPHSSTDQPIALPLLRPWRRRGPHRRISRRTARARPTRWPRRAPSGGSSPASSAARSRWRCPRRARSRPH